MLELWKEKKTKHKTSARKYNEQTGSVNAHGTSERKTDRLPAELCWTTSKSERYKELLQTYHILKERAIKYRYKVSLIFYF